MTRLKSYVPLLVLLGSNQVLAQTVTIPSGTKVMGELDQQVTSDAKEFEVGDRVEGHVWRNIVVDGQTVIEAGAPIVLRVSDINKRRIAGRGGDVEIQAVSVNAVDGTEIFLDGGYDKQGSHRTGLSASLSALVFWPAIFIRGKEAVLEPGTLFDASIPANTRIGTSGRLPTIRIDSGSKVSVDVLYERIADKARDLPLRLTVCEQELPTSVRVTAVNDAEIEPIGVALGQASKQGECTVVEGTVSLKSLSEHFRRGINRFTVATGSARVEVVLDIEM